MPGIDSKMAWRNIWRNPRRSILTMSAVAFATLLLIFMLSWQFGSYETMINTAVKIRSGHLQVQARGFNDQQSIRLVVSKPQAVADVLDRTPKVAGYTFRAKAFSLVSSNDRTCGALVVGIDPAGEARVSTLEEIVREGSYLSAKDDAQALVGRLLAKRLKAGPGDEMVLLGQGRDGSIAATVVRIKGIFSSGQDEFDRSVVHVPLDFFADVYAMRGGVHEVVAVGESLDDVAGLKRALAEALEGKPQKYPLVALDWKELMPGLIQAIRMDLVSGFIFYIILIVVVAFSILNTFLMAIFERTREFGVLMAVGTTPGRLTKLLLIESVTMTGVGIVVGIIIGSLITWYFQVHGLVISGAAELMRQYGLPERMHPQLSVLSVAVGSGVVLAITLLTALYPALKVRRLRPVEAMSHV